MSTPTTPWNLSDTATSPSGPKPGSSAANLRSSGHGKHHSHRVISEKFRAARRRRLGLGVVQGQGPGPVGRAVKGGLVAEPGAGVVVAMPGIKSNSSKAATIAGSAPPAKVGKSFDLEELDSQWM